MSHQKKNDREDLSSLLHILIFAPIGAITLLLEKLGGKDAPKKNPPQQKQAPESKKAPSAPRQEPPKKRPVLRGKDPLKQLSQKAKNLARAGGWTAVICAFVLLACLGDSAAHLLQGNHAQFWVEILELLPFWVALPGGLLCLRAGQRRQKQVLRFRNYLAMAGRRSAVSISSLASAAGLPPKTVREDLREMLDLGLFPAGYLDLGGDMLVLSGEGLREEPKTVETEAQTPPPSQGDRENAILGEIRAVKESISNQKLAEQVDRIGLITAKILDYQKSHPEKSPQLHSFLSYYLPTTLKILRAYSQLEAQEVAGENITAAMERIEGMMDKVVEGFEKQLDQLFQGAAMDITADVAVLERMLAKDGLAGQGMTLGL